jgi:hypothetical protein
MWENAIFASFTNILILVFAIWVSLMCKLDDTPRVAAGHAIFREIKFELKLCTKIIKNMLGMC